MPDTFVQTGHRHLHRRPCRRGGPYVFLGRRTPCASGRVHAADGRSRPPGRRGKASGLADAAPGEPAARGGGELPVSPERHCLSMDGWIPSSAAICICGRPLLSKSATASRLNSGVNSRLVLPIKHLRRPQGAYQRCAWNRGRISHSFRTKTSAASRSNSTRSWASVRVVSANTWPPYPLLDADARRACTRPYPNQPARQSRARSTASFCTLIISNSSGSRLATSRRTISKSPVTSIKHDAASQRCIGLYTAACGGKLCSKNRHEASVFKNNCNSLYNFRRLWSGWQDIRHSSAKYGAASVLSHRRRRKDKWDDSGLCQTTTHTPFQIMIS